MHTDELQNLINNELGLKDSDIAAIGNQANAASAASHLYNLCYKELFVRIADTINEKRQVEFRAILEKGEVGALRDFIKKYIGEPDAYILKSFEQTLHDLETAQVPTRDELPMGAERQTRLQEAQKIIDKDVRTLLKIPNFTDESTQTGSRAEEWLLMQKEKASTLLAQADSVDGTNVKGKIALWLASVAAITKQLPLPEEIVSDYALRAISAYLAKKIS